MEYKAIGLGLDFRTYGDLWAWLME